ncbi:MAG: tetratricopeptide repeat protein [Gammaproteobacteria bacterium]|nr:tetratricopeptide repeat protein [Gammaproteobacteria bacterium]MDH4256271.1 tetratricopeptide repeat protein [Gammaproteobacteria bacterium]MDH5311498.1 tetratricopeptide repeat protein [Gammaproteobacteria bacterium]
MTEYLTLSGRKLMWPALAALLSLIAAPTASAQDTADTAAVAAHLLEAEAALEDLQYKRAAEEYRKAAELSDNAETARQATRVGYTYGFNEDALLSAQRWAELEPESDEAMLYVGQLQLRLGEIRDAEKSFRELLERGEEPPEERLISLIPILSQEDEIAADQLMRRLAKPYPKSAYAHYAAAVMALQAGDGEEAARRADQAIEIEPEWVKPKLLYSRALLLQGKEDEAIDYAARMVGDDPHPDPEARLELAIMYLSAGRDDDALSQVNQILLEDPARSDALRLMAIINFRLDNLDAAWDDFEDLLATGRYTMDALYYLARIADRRSEADRAIALYSQVTSGSNAVISQRRAAGLISQEGDTEAALEHLQKFADTYPNYAVEMVQAQAQLLATAERYDEALEVYDRVRNYRPDEEGVLLGRAELLLRMGRLDDAIAQYRQAVEQFPESATSLNALGYTLADRTTEYDEAQRLIKKALKLDPDSPAIIDSWGWVLYRQGKLEQALKELRRAYQDFPDPEIAAHIVEVLWKLGRLDEALEVLEEAERENPEDPLLLDIRERAFPSEPG